MGDWMQIGIWRVVECPGTFTLDSRSVPLVTGGGPLEPLATRSCKRCQVVVVR